MSEQCELHLHPGGGQVISGGESVVGSKVIFMQSNLDAAVIGLKVQIRVRITVGDGHRATIIVNNAGMAPVL